MLFLDECHLLWGDISGYGWSRRNERVDVEVKSTRERQTYYGALDYLTKRFVVHEYSAGNEDNTVAFLKYLQSLFEQSTRKRDYLGWCQLPPLGSGARVSQPG